MLWYLHWNRWKITNDSSKSFPTHFSTPPIPPPTPRVASSTVHEACARALGPQLQTSMTHGAMGIYADLCGLSSALALIIQSPLRTALVWKILKVYQTAPLQSPPPQSLHGLLLRWLWPHKNWTRRLCIQWLSLTNVLLINHFRSLPMWLVVFSWAPTQLRSSSKA